MVSRTVVQGKAPISLGYTRQGRWSQLGRYERHFAERVKADSTTLSDAAHSSSAAHLYSSCTRQNRASNRSRLLYHTTYFKYLQLYRSQRYSLPCCCPVYRIIGWLGRTVVHGKVPISPGYPRHGGWYQLCRYERHSARQEQGGCRQTLPYRMLYMPQRHLYSTCTR